MLCPRAGMTGRTRGLGRGALTHRSIRAPRGTMADTGASCLDFQTRLTLGGLPLGRCWQ
jgi:hypothetical protein